MIDQLIPEDEPAWKVILDLKDIVELVVAPLPCPRDEVQQHLSLWHIKSVKSQSTDRDTKKYFQIRDSCQNITFWSIIQK